MWKLLWAKNCSIKIRSFFRLMGLCVCACPLSKMWLHFCLVYRCWILLHAKLRTICLRLYLVYCNAANSIRNSIFWIVCCFHKIHLQNFCKCVYIRGLHSHFYQVVSVQCGQWYKIITTCTPSLVVTIFFFSVFFVCHWIIHNFNLFIQNFPSNDIIRSVSPDLEPSQ